MNNTVNAETSLFGVIGNPVSHSLSPVMHNSAFRHTGYNGVYLAFAVKELEKAIWGVRSLGIKGASVTIPHKVSVMAFLDEVDQMASDIGAVNTIVNRSGRLVGYNTDCLGAVRALKQVSEIRDKQVLMIGAGGAARAIGFGIQAEGGRLSIVNILEDEGKALARDLGTSYYHISEFGKMDYDILINATPVGMIPQTEEMPVAKDTLKEERVVMDIIYNPLKTRLLMEADKIGCRTVCGHDMFVYQGVAQFELWTGLTAPVDVMRKVVLEALEKH